MKDYLGSNKNLAGAAMAILGLVVTLLVLGDKGPGIKFMIAAFVAVCFYGVAFLMVPNRRVRLVIDPNSPTAQAAQLKVELSRLERKVYALGAKLPPDVHRSFKNISGQLTAILDRVDALSATSEDLFVVTKTINDYLPTSLETYANLPRRFAMRRAKGQSRSPHDELMSQMGLLEQEMDQVLEAVVAGDVQKLQNQGRFLDARFHDSDLD